MSDDTVYLGNHDVYVRARRTIDTDPQEAPMPVVRALMDSLVERHGKERGEQIYHAMEAEGKGPFGPGGKYRELHEEIARRNGGQPLGTKKPRPRGRKRG